MRANPDAPIGRCKDRTRIVTGQALPGRNVREGKLTKPVESSRRAYPYVSFTIFEEAEDYIAREAVGCRKHVRPAVVYMNESLLDGAYPETSIAVSEQ
jgi:hypothetical protein